MSGNADPRLADLLASLIGWCEKTRRLTTTREFDDFDRDEIVQLAVAMAVIQIGEISGRIAKKFPDFADKHPELELHKASAMRNRLAHGYEQVEIAILWDTARISIAKMLAILRSVVEEYDLDQP